MIQMFETKHAADGLRKLAAEMEQGRAVLTAFNQYEYPALREAQVTLKWKWEEGHVEVEEADEQTA